MSRRPKWQEAMSTANAGGRMAGEDRRRQIVNVAIRLFSERGFRGTTTKEIAGAAGVSEAIIFRHFATKDELYNAIIDHKACAADATGQNPALADAVMGFVAEAVERKDDGAVFEGIALTMLEHHERDPEFLRLLLYSALEGHQLAQMFWDRNVSLMYEFLGGYIRERQRDGAFRDADPMLVVRAFVGMIIHHSLTNTLWDKPRKLLDVSDRDAAHEFTRILLRGVSKNVQPAAARARSAKRSSLAAIRPRKKK